jgi:hypothetical protein
MKKWKSMTKNEDGEVKEQNENSKDRERKRRLPCMTSSRTSSTSTLGRCLFHVALAPPFLGPKSLDGCSLGSDLGVNIKPLQKMLF